MSDREKRLEERNRKMAATLEGIEWVARERREALADDAAGSVTTTDAPHSIGYMGNDTPPQHRDALEACPFCGEVPTQGFVGDEDGGYHAIECRNCNGSEGRPFIGVHSHSSREGRDVWNRRALSEHTLLPYVERLQNERDEALSENNELKRKLSEPAVPEAVRRKAASAVVCLHRWAVKGGLSDQTAAECLQHCQSALAQHGEGRVPEDMLRVYQHARGTCFGQDWNKGTAASHHRRELVEAVNRIDPLPNLDAAPAPDADEREDG